jgi:hypothetical protein
MCESLSLLPIMVIVPFFSANMTLSKPIEELVIDLRNCFDTFVICVDDISLFEQKRVSGLDTSTLNMPLE